eukprot:4696850-Amphidinium_carterae.1
MEQPNAKPAFASSISSAYIRNAPARSQTQSFSVDRHPNNFLKVAERSPLPDHLSLFSQWAFVTRFKTERVCKMQDMKMLPHAGTRLVQALLPLSGAETEVACHV